jgi:Rrf2 family iron-sulfur cluster assembly transcriptional regulator
MDQISIKDVLDCVGENINPAKDILGTEAESANTVEFHLSKGYFQNLGIIMREYLTTTSLGDLARKAKEVEAEVAANQTPAQTTETVTDAAIGGTTQSTTDAPTSGIRSPLGEINQ